MIVQIVRAGVHFADGLPLVYCGGGCGETLRLGEGDIAIRTRLGWGAPVCPCCRLVAQMVNVADMVLPMLRRQPTENVNPWGYE